MGAGGDHYESFTTAVEDPYLGALLGTIDEPDGSPIAARASRAALAWWDEHGTGPTCSELLDAVFNAPNWDA